MNKVITQVTQGGADTFTSVAVPTGLEADGRSGWEVVGMRVLWVNGLTVAAVDHVVHAKIQTIATLAAFTSPDEVDRVSWGVQNTAGVAVAYTFEPVREHMLFIPRVTVQPNIYVAIESTASNQSNVCQISVYYNVIKLTDLEVLRLLAGGA